jgi:hypothetical protein
MRQGWRWVASDGARRCESMVETTAVLPGGGGGGDA